MHSIQRFNLANKQINGNITRNYINRSKISDLKLYRFLYTSFILVRTTSYWKEVSGGTIFDTDVTIQLQAYRRTGCKKNRLYSSVYLTSMDHPAKNRLE